MFGTTSLVLPFDLINALDFRKPALLPSSGTGKHPYKELFPGTTALQNVAFHSISLQIKLCTKVIDNITTLSVRSSKSMITCDPCHAMNPIRINLCDDKRTSVYGYARFVCLSSTSTNMNLMIFKNKHLYSAYIIINSIYRKFISHYSYWHSTCSYEKSLSIEWI